MGQVHEAIHVSIGKRLAIKVLHPWLAIKEEMVERFEQEAKAAATVDHPAVVDIFDAGVTDDGVHFLVMELLEGETVADLLRRQRQLDVKLALSIVCRLLMILAHAHERGVIHRDIKPANVFLVRSTLSQDAVKLLDFGISKIPSAPEADPDTRRSPTGGYLGTPHYVAPEQMLGFQDADARSDLFSVGVVLYRALTGRVPYEEKHGRPLLFSMVRETAKPPSAYRNDLPEGLDAAAVKAVSPSPHERYQSAVEMLSDLLPFTERDATERDGQATQLSPPLDRDFEMCLEVTKVEAPQSAHSKLQRGGRP
jgi:serine/threonine-protein kinase